MENILRGLNRRRLLASVAALPILAATADGRTISGNLPWSPFSGAPPRPVNPLGWYFFTPTEAATVEAIVDRLIPADHLSPGGKDCGCAVFIDRQLAGYFGHAERYEREAFPKVEEILQPYLTTPITFKTYNVETTLCEHFVQALTA